MGISVDVLSTLRADGHDAVHLFEQGLHRLPDDEILQKAAVERRILLVHDLDFSRLLALLRGSEPSIISFRLRKMTPINVARHLRAVIARWPAELAAGAVISVRDGAARCRLLPLMHEESNE
jgi:predicted nuclease of predicted toxin-antitoxin system